MSIEIETILEIAMAEFAKVFADASNNRAVTPEVEEIEELPTGNYMVTLGYWSRDSKPNHEDAAPKPRKGAVILDQSFDPGPLRRVTGINQLFNPWRRKYKRVEIDPKKGKAVAIRMYEPALGVS